MFPRRLTSLWPVELRGKVASRSEPRFLMEEKLVFGGNGVSPVKVDASDQRSAAETTGGLRGQQEGILHPHVLG